MRLIERRLVNQMIVAMAPQFTVADHAPSTFRDIMSLQPLVVWSGASDHTIYADRWINFAFRAWHDDCHKAALADFTLQGEALAVELQIRQALERFPVMPQAVADLLRFEVLGQATALEQFGSFPLDQREAARLAGFAFR